MGAPREPMVLMGVNFEAYVPVRVAKAAVALWLEQDRDKAVAAMLCAEAWRPYEADLSKDGIPIARDVPVEWPPED